MNEYLDRFDRRFDLDRAFKISITQSFDEAQPNHFGVSPATCQPIRLESFVGSVNEGGSCNCEIIETMPHCNGTHTETVGHIVDTAVPISDLKLPVLMPAVLITVEPSSVNESSDSYRPQLSSTDRVISANSLRRAFRAVDVEQFEALIVRTLPNELDKLSLKYGADYEPPFFSVEAMELVFESGFGHLLVDIPSVDRMHDDGKLTCHHIFWNVVEETHVLTESAKTDKTITEMIFVHEAIADGVYLLNLQVADWKTDAAVSRPVIFPTA